MVLLKLNMAAASLALSMHSWYLDMHVCGMLARTSRRIPRGFIKLELIETI